MRIASLLIVLSLLYLQSSAIAAVQFTDDPLLSGEKLAIPVYEWKDDSVKTKAVIVALHGLTFYGACFNDVGNHLASYGYPVYAYDFRGFGHWHYEKEKFPNDGKIHYGQSLDDGRKLIERLHVIYPDKKIFCLGESLGANLGLMLANSCPLIDGLILSGLGVKACLHPRLRWIHDVPKGIFFPNKHFILSPYSKLYLASDPAVTEVYLSDPKIFRGITYIDLVKAAVTNNRSIKQAPQIPAKVKILIIAGEKDLTYKPSALPPFAKRIGAERTTIEILPNKGHLLLELQPLDPRIANIFDKWLDKQTQ